MRPILLSQKMATTLSFVEQNSSPLPETLDIPFKDFAQFKKHLGDVLVVKDGLATHHYKGNGEVSARTLVISETSPRRVPWGCWLASGVVSALAVFGVYKLVK